MAILKKHTHVYMEQAPAADSVHALWPIIVDMLSGWGDHALNNPRILVCNHTSIADFTTVKQVLACLQPCEIRQCADKRQELWIFVDAHDDSSRLRVLIDREYIQALADHEKIPLNFYRFNSKPNSLPWLRHV